MSNKQQLQTNNIDLSTILTTIGDLPIKALVEAAASQGLYAWTKTLNTGHSGTVSFALLNDTSGNVIQVTSADLDVGSLSNLDFDGVSGTYTYATATVNWSMTADTITLGSQSAPYTYDPGTGRITMEGLTVPAYTFSSATITPKDIALGYVVSNTESSYPDGGTQDGYYYERVAGGVVGIDYGEVTISAETQDITINHTLGVEPKYAILAPKNVDFKSYKSIMMAFGFNPSTATRYANSSGYVETVIATQASTNSWVMDKSTVLFRSDSYYNFTTGTYVWVAIA